jgi:hypothetical protein
MARDCFKASTVAAPRLARFRDLVKAYSQGLGGELSEVDQNLVRQAASLTLAAEILSSDVVNGKAIDADALVRINSEARRVLGMLRAKAEANKPATTESPLQYAARRAAEKAASAIESDAAWARHCALRGMATSESD